MPLLLMTSVAMSLAVLGADGTGARQKRDERSSQRLLGPMSAIYFYRYGDVPTQ